MQQLDMFNSSTTDYLFNEIEKIRNSLDRRSRAMFATITELQDQILQLQEKKEQKDEPTMR